MIPFMDPLGAPTQLAVGGEGHAPVAAVLLARVKVSGVGVALSLDLLTGDRVAHFA